MLTKDLRTYIMESIEVAIHKVMDMPRETPEEYEEFRINRSMWVNMVADRILSGFHEFLPEPVDMDGKYEDAPYSGLHIQLSKKRNGRDDIADGNQLDFLAAYAHDAGYNQYHIDVLRQLESLYKSGEKVL